MRPLVSVLVLAYNHGAYVADTLESILKQETAFPFEVLIGEDCSTDDTREVVEAFVRRNPGRVRMVSSESNVGMQANFKRIVLAATGRYVAVCEGDDYWNTCDKLARQVDFLESHAEYGAVHSDFTHIVSDGDEWRALSAFWRHNQIAIPEGEVFETLLVRNFVQTCTLMVRAEMAREYLAADLPSGAYKVGDWPLCLFVATKALIGYIDEPLATYRQVVGSATNQGHLADIARGYDHIAMASDFCRLTGRADLEPGAHQEALRMILDRAVRARDVEQVRKVLAAMDELRLKPGLLEHLKNRLGTLVLRNRYGLRVLGPRLVSDGPLDLAAYTDRPIAPGDCG